MKAKRQKAQRERAKKRLLRAEACTKRAHGIEERQAWLANQPAAGVLCCRERKAGEREGKHVELLGEGTWNTRVGVGQGMLREGLQEDRNG